MILIGSTAVMVILLIGMFILQHRNANRAKRYFIHSDPLIDTLHDSALKKYRTKYGKDPTGQFRPISAQKLG